MKSSDVVVVGAGVIGLSVAYRARLAGFTVSVVDDQPGAEPGVKASMTAAGMIAPITEMHYGEGELLKLNLASARRYPALVEELREATGHDVGYRTCGTLFTAFDSDDNAAVGELHQFALENGLAVERLRARECRQLEPMLAPSVRGGMLVASDHQLDPRALLAALLAAATDAGVDIHRDRVAEVLHGADRVSGVRLRSGEVVSSGAVVIAAGAWSGAIEGIPDEFRPPIRPVKGQLLRMRRPLAGEFLTRTVRGLVQGQPIYLVPRADGRLIVGATSEEQGFDGRVTAEAVYTLLRDARLLVPGITECEFVEVSTAFRPGTPDNAPLIGRYGPEGLIWATGHYRHGVLLTPITAETITAVLRGEVVPAEADPFTPDRFARSKDEASTMTKVGS